MKQKLLDFLIQSQNADGGWGYFPNKASAVEPSSYALLSLRANPPLASTFRKAIDFMTSKETLQGGWPVTVLETEPAAWVSPLAGFALLCAGSAQVPLKTAELILRSFGRTPQSWKARMAEWLGYGSGANVNTRLGGWGWSPGTASWVEPTCYSLIFLKRLRTKMRLGRNDRAFLIQNREKPALSENQLNLVIAEAESMVYDRMCTGGGWNYGNSRVLGEDLRPYPLTTALALIALEDHKTRNENQRSLRYLRSTVASEKSSLSVCYACLCLDLYSQDWNHLLETLAELYQSTEFFGSVKTHALALLALAAKDGKNIFDCLDTNRSGRY